MKTLLHICCAPCANHPIEVLRGDGIEVAGFWYNPNIHPFTEYRARRNCLRDYAQTIELPVIEKNDYALRPFIRTVAANIEHRCGKCYEMRLFETAKTAKELGFDSFTSSLFISPYQNHELMMETAQRAAKEYGVEFLYRDFRPYFKAGQQYAREHDFYMQKYCGCVFSGRRNGRSLYPQPAGTGHQRLRQAFCRQQPGDPPHERLQPGGRADSARNLSARF